MNGIFIHTRFCETVGRVSIITVRIKLAFLLFMDFQYSVYYGDLSAFYPEDNNFSDSNGIFYSVGEKQKVSSVESWLHAPTETHVIKIT